MNRHLFDKFLIDLLDVEVGKPGHFELHRERLQQQIFFDRSDLDEGLSQTPSLGLLDVQRLEELGFG